MGDIHSAKYQRDRAAKKREWKAAKRPCHLCGQRLDYDLPKTDPMHFQLDHIRSRKTHPHLETDPLNWAPSHARCNKGKQAGPMAPGLGTTSEQW
jgi:hypothetical protein